MLSRPSVVVFRKPLSGTFRTQAFQNIVDAFDSKTFRQFHHRHMNIFKTKGPVALFTIEMRMKLLYRAIAFFAADSIFQGTGSIVHTMDQMLSQEEIDGPENGGLIDSIQNIFQIG